MMERDQDTQQKMMPLGNMIFLMKNSSYIQKMSDIDYHTAPFAP